MANTLAKTCVFSLVIVGALGSAALEWSPVAPKGETFGRASVGAAQQPTVRVTQFYDPRRGGFGPDASDALMTPPNAGPARFFDGPIASTATPRTHVSPFAASEQTWWTRTMTGRGSYRNYVEFDVLAGDLQSIGGLKGVLGLGRYQQFVPNAVSLSGANAVFGTLAPNYGQYAILAGAAIASGYGLYEAFDND